MPSVEPDELCAPVAERIREQAAKRGMPLRQLAEKAEVSRGHMWNVLGGKSAASTDLLARIAKVLDIDPDVLVKRPRKPRASST